MDAPLIVGEALKLLARMGQHEFLTFFWLTLLLDVPRHLLGVIVTALVPSPDRPAPPAAGSISLLVACRNEPKLRECLDSARGQVDEIIVVDDASDTPIEVPEDVMVIRLPERVGKPAAMNVGLPQCRGEFVIVLDGDTLLTPGAVARARAHFDRADVGGVGFNLGVRNQGETLTTRYQAIEYAISISAGRRIADAIGILPNVSGAAGMFRREALEAVGGYDVEVAEDAALAMKLRSGGWGLRFADDAMAMTTVPETPLDLIVQRVRWDSAVITIWGRKFIWTMNPFSNRFSLQNLMVTLDVLTFSAALPLALFVYIAVLYSSIGTSTLVLLTAAIIVLWLMESLIVMLAGVSPMLLVYVPFYLVTQLAIMRPVTILAVLAELLFTISRFDEYIPRSQRDRLT